jgi:uncharacterized membrane protein YedE/YeeE
MFILLAVIAGAGLGYILERGDLCFHSTLRGLFRAPRQLDLFRAYLLALLIATPLVFGMRALGWIDPWIPPFYWQANIFGGLIFGIGMVVAASCITGFFYKLGHGMLGTLVGLGAWAIGDILVYRGALSSLRGKLTTDPLTVDGNNATVLNLFGPPGVVLLVILGLVAIIWLWRSREPSRWSRGKLWGWLLLGVAVGLFTSLAWLLAKAGGSNYPYGTSYVPTSLYLAVFEGADLSPWIPVALISLIPGAFIAARRSGTLWVRGEHWRRYIELALGGFLMGVGAAFAGGCNLGHSLIGVPLLSIGSIITTIAMAAGVFLAHQATRLISSRRKQQLSAEGSALGIPAK